VSLYSCTVFRSNLKTAVYLELFTLDAAHPDPLVEEVNVLRKQVNQLMAGQIGEEEDLVYPGQVNYMEGVDLALMSEIPYDENGNVDLAGMVGPRCDLVRLEMLRRSAIVYTWVNGSEPDYRAVRV
jgi:hypothetical protein